MSLAHLVIQAHPPVGSKIPDNLIVGLHWSSVAAAAVSSRLHEEQRCRGVYMSGTTVCAAQMGINFRCQSTG